MREALHHTLLEPLTALLQALKYQLGYQHPFYSSNPYISPPRAVRYTLERWSYEDEREQHLFLATHKNVACASCYSLYGAFFVGEWIIEDSLSIDTFHVVCASRWVRARAFIGAVLCALRAVLGIDN